MSNPKLKVENIAQEGENFFEGLLTFPIKVEDIKVGTLLVSEEDRPYEVNFISWCKCSGLRGCHRKASIKGIDLFDGRNVSDVLPLSHYLKSPIITRTKWTLVWVDSDDYVSMMDDRGNLKQNIKLPTKLENEYVITKIRNGLDESKTIILTVFSAMGLEKIEDASTDYEVLNC